MGCPKQKDLWMAVGDRGASSVREHARSCDHCQQELHEAEQVDDLFRRHFAAPPPPPFLWTRIEAQLDALPAPTAWERFLSAWRARVVHAVAAACLTAAIGSLTLFLQQSQAGEQLLLARIDAAYEKEVARTVPSSFNPFAKHASPLHKAEDNPFGRVKPARTATQESNPFRLAAHFENRE